MNVSEQLLKILTEEDIHHIFGIAGDALNPLVSAIAKQNEIKWIRVKHEENAAYAAFAQGAIGKNPGVCASTVGPGALHLINGLYNAKRERCPVLAITGQVPVSQLGTNFFQEVNLEKIFSDVCEYQAIIRSPEDAPRKIQKAIRIARNNKSVCRIELPADIAGMDTPQWNYTKSLFHSESEIITSENQLQKAASLIEQSKKPAILGGAGCREARKEVLEFADKIKAPITHTTRASDIFDHETENVVGLTGLIGNPSGYKAVMECDLLIMLGTDFPYTEFLPEKTKTIQVDIRPENIGNRIPVSLGIHGNINSTISKLNTLCTPVESRPFLDEMNELFTGWKSDNEKNADPGRNGEFIHPQILAKRISDVAANDAVFSIDTGTAVIWATNNMNFHSQRRIIGSFNHGSMAVGFPAAMGAQFESPDKEIWALVGDGAFNMSLHEFSTAVEYDLPLKIIIFNNSELGFVKIEMEEAGLAPNFDALKVDNFNFADYARLCGGDGIQIKHSKDIGDAVKAAKNSRKPFIVDAIVNSGELSFPPKIGINESIDFGFSKAKEIIKAIKGNKEQWDNLKNEVEAYFS